MRTLAFLSSFCFLPPCAALPAQVVLGTGILGIGVVAGMAVRWTRRRADASAASATVGTRPDLEDQLDDELRDLD